MDFQQCLLTVLAVFLQVKRADALEGCSDPAVTSQLKIRCRSVADSAFYVSCSGLASPGTPKARLLINVGDGDPLIKIWNGERVFQKKIHGRRVYCSIQKQNGVQCNTRMAAVTCLNGEDIESPGYDASLDEFENMHTQAVDQSSSTGAGESTTHPTDGDTSKAGDISSSPAVDADSSPTVDADSSPATDEGEISTKKKSQTAMMIGGGVGLVAVLILLTKRKFIRKKLCRK